YKEQAAEALKLTAHDMLKNKLIDDIIKEPLGGAHQDTDWMYAKMKKVILETYNNLNTLSVEERIDQRIDKFSAMGVVVEA
ncbi:MAG: acetyl-CoA carboxylase carboxyl transferase subunit alpha, partial [Cytophagales bacterium]|nr:acetyl-CoA carboxylase carboxyl transferase subunit alpha [Cytophaga sp.]